MKKAEFEFNLLTPFDYHCNGVLAKAEVLSIKAPVFKQASHVSKIKQYFFVAFKHQWDALTPEQQAKAEADEKKAELEAKENGTPIVDNQTMEVHARQVLGALTACPVLDIAELFKTFAKLLADGTAFIADDNKTPLTSGLVDRLSYEDVERLLGEYIVHFLK